MSLIPELTNAGRGLLISALSGGTINFTKIKIGNGALPVQSVGDLWYDPILERLRVWNGTWQTSERNMTVSEDAPLLEATNENDFWYNNIHEELYVCSRVWDAAGEVITCAPSSPTTMSTGSLWYDDSSHILYRNSEHSWGISSKRVTFGSSKPHRPNVHDFWYDTRTNTLYEYIDEYVFIEKDSTVFVSATEPVSPNDGDFWHDTTVDTTFLYMGTMGGWLPFNREILISATEPGSPTVDMLWYDTANDCLKEYLRVAEVSFRHFTQSATAPQNPYLGDFWYDTENSVVKESQNVWVIDDRPFTYSAIAPETPELGDLWRDNNTYRLKVCNKGWVADYSTLIYGERVPGINYLTELANPMLTASISSIAQESDYVSLTCVFDNSQNLTGFHWTETGIYAEDEDGNEVLYAYCHAGELTDYIPSNASGRIQNVNMTILVAVGDAESITATLGDGAVYTPLQDFNNHLRDFSNPHKVGKKDVGLDRVVNVEPVNMIIEYEIADELSENNSGEKLGIVLGKVKRAINTLIRHLTALNPHQITPKKISAAELRHQHGTVDITTGVLSTNRGGTGVESIPALAQALEQYFHVPFPGTFTGNGERKRKIHLGFRPSAVILANHEGRMADDGAIYGGIATGEYGVRTPTCVDGAHETSWYDGHTVLLIDDDGFFVSSRFWAQSNSDGKTYHYVAFK